MICSHGDRVKCFSVSSNARRYQMRTLNYIIQILDFPAWTTVAAFDNDIEANEHLKERQNFSPDIIFRMIHMKTRNYPDAT